MAINIHMHRPTPPSVVITGLGILACNGIGRRPYWDAIRAGRSGIRRIQRFDASDLPNQIAGELWDFDPADFMSKRTLKNWHRHVHQAVAASRLAVADGDLAKAGYDSERLAGAMGTSVGSPNEMYKTYMDAYRSGGYKKVSKFASSAFSGHSATVHVTIDIGLRGPAMTISSGCATGLDVLAWGTEQIRHGRADAALVGATECPIFMESIVAACSLGILSKRNDEPAKAMRPFDRYRDGIVLSEAACALVLEREDTARARGARILAEVAGNGSTAEARNPLILDPEGRALARACEAALLDGGLSSDDVDYIQAHGASLDMYDRCETSAYKRVLGDRAYRVPVSAVKSMVGQSYAAGGLLGVGAALCTLSEGVVTPTLNLDEPDPRCDLDYVPHHARLNDIGTALVTAMSFGGTHSATVLRRVA